MIVSDYDGTLSTYFARRKSLVDSHLNTLFPEYESDTEAQELVGALAQSVHAPGKRMRPILAIATYELFCTDLETIVPPACAVELIHTSSLIIDDLPCMDNATQRRGEKTSHVVFGESVSILASVGLGAQVFEILSRVTHKESNALIKTTAEFLGMRGLVLGQYMDLFSFGAPVPLPKLERGYELKTAALFRLAVHYGALLGGASERERGALDEYARRIGIVFQIRDDIIDATQTREESGKDAGKDAENKKVNYVSLLGLEHAQRELETHARSAHEELEKLSGSDTRVLSDIADYLVTS